MSLFQETLRKTRDLRFVLEISKGGRKRYFGHRNFTIPYATGNDIFVEGIINKDFTVGATLNLRTFTHNYQSIPISLQNKDDLHEDDGFFENGDAAIYAWTPGLDWLQCEKRFTGYSVKLNHTKSTYNIKIEDILKNIGNTNQPVASDVSGQVQTWTSLTSGEGNYYNIVYGAPALVERFAAGNATSGLTSSAGYMAGHSSAVTADYSGGILKMYGTDGVEDSYVDHILAPLTDLDGNTLTIMWNQGTGWIEIYGHHDGPDGYYSGTADKVLTHPGHIVFHLLDNYSVLPREFFDIPTLKGFAESMPALKFEVVIKSNASIASIISRFGKQALASVYQRGGKISLFWIDVFGSAVGKINTDLDAVGAVDSTKTPDDMVINSIVLRGSFNRIDDTYAYNRHLNRFNNSECEQSYGVYGERPAYNLECLDVDDSDTADICANRRLQFYGHRHDLLQFSVNPFAGWDLQEGSVYEITSPEGPNGGWVDEKFVLIGKVYSSQGQINTTWWRVNV